MAGKPAERSDSDHAPAGARERQGEPARLEEQVGPIAVARHVKDDGRALIVYTRETPYQA